MATIYVTEHCRFLREPFKGMPKQLEGVKATVSDKPEDFSASPKHFKPEAWADLLAQDGVMYRYKREPYARVA